jgi:hypothetical protein
MKFQKCLAQEAKFARLKYSNVAENRKAVRYTKVDSTNFDAKAIDGDNSIYSKWCSEMKQLSIGIVTRANKTVTVTMLYQTYSGLVPSIQTLW